MRLTNEQLNEIKEKFDVTDLWSWSRFHTYETSPFEYFLKYVIKKKPDKTDSAYAPYGAICHEILEKYYLGEIKYEEMISEFEDNVFTLELGDFKFNRTDEEKNKNIKEKYYENIEHFFKNHTKITDEFEIERFIPIKVGNYVFQGYIDMLRKDKDGNHIIQDWKTSTIYKGEKIIKEAPQLVLYAEGIRQMGVPIEKIKCCWNFLKYVNVSIEQANGNVKERQIERCKLGSSLIATVKMWLKKLGYTENMEYYIDSVLSSNSLNNLPNDVKSKFKIEDCYVYIPYTIDTINEIKKRILSTIPEIIDKTNTYWTTTDEKVFYDDEEKVKKESFYFANLCEYSANLHKPYANYLKTLEENDLFTGVGVDKDKCLDNEKITLDDDMSWLDEI